MNKKDFFYWIDTLFGNENSHQDQGTSRDEIVHERQHRHDPVTHAGDAPKRAVDQTAKYLTDSALMQEEYMVLQRRQVVLLQTINNNMNILVQMFCAVHNIQIGQPEPTDI